MAGLTVQVMTATTAEPVYSRLLADWGYRPGHEPPPEPDGVEAAGTPDPPADTADTGGDGGGAT